MKHYCRLIIILTLLCACKNNKKQELQSTVYSTKNGYGYRIVYKNEVLIQQEYIPSIEGNKTFCDSMDAAKTANFVKKLIQSKKSPTVTKADLTRLKIKTKC